MKKRGRVAHSPHCTTLQPVKEARSSFLTLLGERLHLARGVQNEDLVSDHGEDDE